VSPVGQSAVDRSVGVVGLGIMGTRMAATLRRAGWAVVATTRSESARAAADATGIQIVDTAAAVAASANVVVLSLPDAGAVHAVLDGPGGLAEAAIGVTVVDTTTLAPSDARDIHRQMASAGIAYLDVPVSGGPQAAADGTLSMMAGGDAAALERAMPVLETLGSRVVHCGGVGAGSVAKACNQLIVLATIGAVAEALAVAEGAGVDPATVREAMLGGWAASPILRLHGERMINRDWAPGGKAKFHLKDMATLAGLSSASGVATPVFNAAADYVRALIDAGGADLDHSAVYAIVTGEDPIA
jgi:2-hydroxy-3-oxopropionate reductase